VTKLFLKFVFIMGCKRKERIENIKMAKFDPPGIKEQVYIYDGLNFWKI